MLTKKEKEAFKKLLEYYEDDGITLEKLCDCSGFARDVKYLNDFCDEETSDFIICFGNSEIESAVMNVKDHLISFSDHPEFNACFSLPRVKAINYDEEFGK